MQALNRKLFNTKEQPIKVLQFGEGNFLRAFADWIIDRMNKDIDFEAGVAVVQPIAKGLIDLLNSQDGLYTLYLNGIRNGKVLSEHQIIDSIQIGIDPYSDYEQFMNQAENPELRFMISNTTEAGIAYEETDQLTDAPCSSFPGKLTALLYKRFQFFNGAPAKGLIHLPCELIDRNGDKLKSIILKYSDAWDLGTDFKNWIHNDNIFCNTLVDRIVPGFPKDKIKSITEELGYKDNLVVEAEQFHLWVIEGPETVQLEFPADSSGLNVVFTDDMEPYRTRKVRILNGAHTSLVPVSYLYGIDRVRESIEDPVIGTFIKSALSQNISPTLDLPEEELQQFTEDVIERFLNPYLEHELMSISLNSISKYKTRVLPSVLEYIERKGALPSYLLFSLAALITFYKGFRNDEAIALKDDPQILAFFKRIWDESADYKTLSNAVLSNASLWGTDLSQLQGVQDQVSAYIESIDTLGMKLALDKFLNQ